MPDIVQWDAVREQYHKGGLLLGNGASMAVHQGFGYASLYEVARQREHLTEAVAGVFAAFGTNDFELVLRRLWQAQLVNTSLSIPPGAVEEAYELVRNALIATVRDSHVKYDDAAPHFSAIWAFMQPFRTVVSLNYDLTVYWAMMAGNSALGGSWFKDCFLHGEFVENWQSRRDPLGAMTDACLVFYPHGNLVLARTPGFEERKIAAGSNSNLLEKILAEWESNNAAPLFICEGTAEHKKRAIENSAYLQRVFREVIPACGETLVIYGWNAAPQDRHILEQVKRARAGGLHAVAVSVFRDNQNEAQRVQELLQGIGMVEISFFDAESPGCWIHPREND
jgi:hypothetical protein